MTDHVLYVEAQAVHVEPSAPVAGYHRASSEPIMISSQSVGPVPPTIVHNINEVGAREYLAGRKWPLGLQNTSIDQLKKIAFRFVICDDSGSMMASDGHKLMQAPNGTMK